MKDVSVVPRRRRLWIALAALAFALTLLIGFWRSVATPPLVPATPAAPQAVDWAEAEAPVDPQRLSAPTLPPLQLGAYITNVNDIDLLNDQFSIELLLWTIWQGDPDQNPSDQLRILNGIYNGDTQRFERIRRDQINGKSWSLYTVRSPVVKRWQLQRYPFDDQLLHVQIGLEDPLQPINLDVVPVDPSAVSPGLLLPGWILKSPTGYASSISLMSDLGRPTAEAALCGANRRVVRSADPAPQPVVRGSGFPRLHARRRPLLHEPVDHPQPGRSDPGGRGLRRGNYVFIAGQLPVTAMTGFIGTLQLIIFWGSCTWWRPMNSSTISSAW